MRLSVIIIVGPGHEDNLFHCLSMLVRQSHQPHEVIVISDGAHRSEFVCQHYQQQLPLIYEHRPNDTRLAFSRNRGAELASGELLVFIDCDMLLNPEALAAYASQAQAHPEAVIFGYCGYLNAYVAPSALVPHRPVNFVDFRFLRYTPTGLMPSPYLGRYLYWYTMSGNFAIAKRLFQALQGFNPQFQGWGGEDMELGERLRQQNIPLLLSIDAWGEHQCHEKQGQFYELKAQPLNELQIQTLPAPQSSTVLTTTSASLHLLDLIFNHYLPQTDQAYVTSLKFPFSLAHIDLGQDQYPKSNRHLMVGNTVPPAPWHSVWVDPQQPHTLLSPLIQTCFAPQKPGLSVIIVTGMGRSDNLYHCLESLTWQTQPPDEVVVISDGEPRSEFVCQSFADRLPLVHHYRPNDLRVGSSRNQGVALSTYDHLVFLDSDVMLNPEALASYVQHLNDQPQAYCIGYCGLDKTFVAPSALKEGRRVNCHDSRYEAVSSQGFKAQPHLSIYPHWYAWSANVALHRQTFMEVGGFPETVYGWGGEDQDFANRLCTLGIPFVYLLDAWGEHQEHPLNGYFYDFKHAAQIAYVYNQPSPQTAQVMAQGPAAQRLQRLLLGFYGQGYAVPFTGDNYPSNIASLLWPQGLKSVPDSAWTLLKTGT
jgi:glycosyltransferase involved in cell wall biosynthesis